MLVFVGLPYAAGSRIYSCAAAICDGELLGLVPRENVEGSHFQSYDDDEALDVTVGEYDSFLSSDVLFEHASMPDLKVAVELGADMDAVTSPALRHALSGATVIAQMASFPETVTSTDEAGLTCAMSRRSCAAASSCRARQGREHYRECLFRSVHGRRKRRHPRLRREGKQPCRQ